MSVEDARTPSDDVLMYLIVRQDLADSWPRGAVAAQVAHAATAVCAELLLMPRTAAPPAAIAYFSSAAHMRKVVVAVPEEQSLLETAAKLQAAGVGHKLWIELPENVPTCIATYPSLKSVLRGLPFLRRLPLYR